MNTHETNENQNINENELNDLLSNTFNDFCKIYKKDLNKTAVDQKISNKKDELNVNDSNISDSHDSSKNEKSLFTSLYESDSELKENWSRLAKSCNQPVENDLNESLLSTLKIISDKAQKISNEHDTFSDEDFTKMLYNLTELSGEQSSDSGIQDNMLELNKIMPLMSNIMENLLSKDFLYPTLSELKLKYPTYLKENGDSLTKDEYIRYENQYKIIIEICEEFENETADDSKQIKSNRFNKILTLMQKMQSYGTPPSVLVSNNSEVFNELNSFSSDINQCSIA